ncbi:dihydropteroate synthase [Chengkuizengella sp. 2205SS18-9]|uniref:Dihydropteroate synthase n=2 Tax=Chengkuizengella axinellae TaxID=3064388 RepID=A0ABT9J666_9BACL|nr:dihydropteroate synthase [Chengkuizengella sp. 2205SS18-9]MDP5276973.1 dihydropteroate synthase [Chengkuizengella sp. 2205SS18-9]
MGILNVTPDSFSDGGKYVDKETAVTRALKMIEEGADIIDVGGESTRPGAETVPLEEELQRVIPIIEALKEAVKVPISIDTYKAEVAKQALKAGAHIVNDVWGLKKDRNMASVIAEYQCPVVIMHNRIQKGYHHFIQDVISDLQESINIAHQAGINNEQIILDPGIGFAKTPDENLILMNYLSDVVAMGYPVLLGTSRKSMIRNVLELPANDVIEGTAATVVYGMMQGCQIVRVHDIKAMKRITAMTDAMLSKTE